MKNQKSPPKKHPSAHQVYQLDYNRAAAPISGQTPNRRFILRDASGSETEQAFENFAQVMDFILDELLSR